MDYTNRTSTDDLYKLCDNLNIKNIIICRKGELKKYLNNKNINNFIINLDDIGPGTHWCALYKPKKMYFDSYGQPFSKEIPKNYKQASTKKELQSIDSEMCGSLCCLWLYYVNFKSNKNYYELFKDCYA